MKKELDFDTSVRVTYKGQFIAFVRTDASVNLKKNVKAVTANHSDQVGSLMQGEIEDLDLDQASKRFFLGTKAPSEEDAQFLGYFDTKQPAKAEIIQKLWPSLEFKPVVTE